MLNVQLVAGSTSTLGRREGALEAGPEGGRSVGVDVEGHVDGPEAGLHVPHLGGHASPGGAPGSVCRFSADAEAGPRVGRAAGRGHDGSDPVVHDLQRHRRRLPGRLDREAVVAGEARTAHISAFALVGNAEVAVVGASRRTELDRAVVVGDARAPARVVRDALAHERRQGAVRRSVEDASPRRRNDRPGIHHGCRRAREGDDARAVVRTSAIDADIVLLRGVILPDRGRPAVQVHGSPPRKGRLAVHRDVAGSVAAESSRSADVRHRRCDDSVHLRRVLEAARRARDRRSHFGCVLEASGLRFDRRVHLRRVLQSGCRDGCRDGGRDVAGPREVPLGLETQDRVLDREVGVRRGRVRHRDRLVLLGVLLVDVLLRRDAEASGEAGSDHEGENPHDAALGVLAHAVGGCRHVVSTLRSVSSVGKEQESSCI